jgi:thiol-disulfide isomerase/thioredoxin
VRQVPSISLIDSEGRLRLANAGSLRQPLEYKLDVRGIIERAGTGATVGTYGQMPRWYPVKELVGQRCPDFEAPTLDKGEIRRWSSMIEPGKINVLMFWSVECPHCRKALPELNQWLKTKANSDGVNIVGAARVSDEAERIKTQEFCSGNGFVFPTLVDRNLDITDRFGVVSTPTFVIVRPDGVIDSVVLSGEGELPDKLEAKKKELLRPASSGT